MTGEVPQWVPKPDQITSWEADPETLQGRRGLAARDQLSSIALESFADVTEPAPEEHDVIEVSQYPESNN